LLFAAAISSTFPSVHSTFAVSLLHLANLIIRLTFPLSPAPFHSTLPLPACVILGSSVNLNKKKQKKPGLQAIQFPPSMLQLSGGERGERVALGMRRKAG